EEAGGESQFYELDITHNEVWKEYNVMDIPTVIIFLGGKPTNRFGSMLRIDELEKALTK
ncbi:unnamed protein product, partial [marine sediment metagenome]